MQNEMKLEFKAISQNEGFARVAVAAFVSQLNPTIEELAEIKTAISEAVTNAVIHAYNGMGGQVYIECAIEDDMVTITVSDNGKGIEDIQKAREPLYTTNPDGERSGMGFTVMETFMDSVEVQSSADSGTRVTMTKGIGVGYAR